MSSPLVKRLSLLFSFFSVLLLIAASAAGWLYFNLRQSLPALDGEARLAGLAAPVRIERDALGVPTITGATRADAARALGYLHAQDRFFQMDLLRRRAAGELAEIFGAIAVPLDRDMRPHGFRALAQQVLARAVPADRAVVEAYVAGVNAGLAALRVKPWEYLVLRTAPAPWRAEDTVLVIHAMWLDLQDFHGNYEQALRAVQFSLGTNGLNFFAPLGTSWDAALDGSTLPEAPIPPLKLAPPAEEKSAALSPSPAGAVAHNSPWAFAGKRPRLDSSELFPGSNSFAVAGTHTAHGAALLANDMHLDLRVPLLWYRASLACNDAPGPRRVTGVTLPGTPIVVAGSNGQIAWGFTNSQVDTADVVVVESDNIAQIQYRTARGWADITERTETIRVKNGEPAPLTVRSTEWGPLLSGPDRDNRFYALRWAAHDPDATDFALLQMETAANIEQAITVAHRCGLPNQNLLVAGSNGAIAWTVAGKIPRRVGYDGRLPASWAYGDRKWDGWLAPEQMPVIRNPADGLLWTANNRTVGGDALKKLGDGQYALGARARQIRDDLRALAASGRPITPRDLLGVQLDDRALFLERWQKLLLAVLTDGAVAKGKSRAELRALVRQWNGRASTDSAAYRLVRAWRTHVAERVFAPIFDQAEAHDGNFSYTQLHYEDPLWLLVNERPARLLNPAFPSWDALLLAAADDVLADAKRARLPLARFTWGARNTLQMEHPFSQFLPGPLARLLNMPAEPLPGDNHMPRVQTPTHGASERMVVAPGHEAEGLFHMPGGQSGHPLSPYYRAGHEAWARGEPTPFLPGPVQHTLILKP